MGWKDYFFSSLFNYVDLISSAMNLTILIRYEFVNHMNNDILILLAVLLMWVKVFYWIRIFSKPASYINLLLRTLKDIVAFLVILIIALGMTTNMFYIVK